MPAFFSHRRGSVVRVTSQFHNDGGLLPFRIASDDLDLDSPLTRAIITQAAIAEHGNYQFLHTLNETIFAYVFGDRTGDLRLSGVCFLDTCPEFEGEDGAQQIIENYRQFRISNAGSPIRMSLGIFDYRAFLTDMRLEIADAEHNIGQWTYNFKSFPGHTK